MTAILVADIHVNEKPADSYRWGLFDWLLEQKADELIIAGDLTDAKDNHPSKLVNQLYTAIMKLEQKYRIIIVRGNHDYLQVDHPFFQFLGDSSDITFVMEPVTIRLSIGLALFVPAGVKWDFKIPKVDYLFTHATFSGAAAENGRILTGVDPDVLKGFDGKVWSGDIHSPQKLRGGQIEYIGAPHAVRFGDIFEPRLVLIDNDGRPTDLHFPAPRKRVFDILHPDDLLEENAAKGDYVKVRCLLRRADYDRWRGYHEDIKRICGERGWKLFSAEPVAIELPSTKNSVGTASEAAEPGELIAAYAKQHKASDVYLEAGYAIMRGETR